MGLRRILQLVRQIGFDPVVSIRSVANLYPYFKNLIKFRIMFDREKNNNYKFILSPALQDRNLSAGQSDGHYFWQDLIAAKWISELKIENLLDIGSRIDGFIAHVLSFTNVTLLDVRPLPMDIPGLNVRVQDIMNPAIGEPEQFACVSSLHSIEHFGLGRYGDPLNSMGHIVGLQNISKHVSVDGQLIVSFPIGLPTIEFDSQRILDPEFPVKILENFSLQEFILIPWRGEPNYNSTPETVDLKIKGQLGLYRFKRVS